MALLFFGAARVCDALQLDLLLLPTGHPLAVAGVAPGAHHVSVLDGDGWSHGWVWVETEDSRVAVSAEPASDAGVDADTGAATGGGVGGGVGGGFDSGGRGGGGILRYPGDARQWLALTCHVRPPWPPAEPVDAPGATSGGTRLSGALDRLGGSEDALLGELQTCFVEGWLRPDASGADRARQWRRLVAALASGGPRALRERPGLLAAAADVLAAQAEATAPAFAGLTDELGFLAEDLADDGRPDLVAAGRRLAAVVDRLDVSAG